MGYVRNTYGCHCFYGDSSFKRYNRAMGGDTLIFNYNSNNTYNCSGHGGGFWGGFGLGLGAGIGNWLGGFFGGMSNMFGFGGFPMFGGYGMSNMFSGFPSWGSFGNWGFGGTPSVSSNNNAATSTVTKTVTVNKTDADAQGVLDLDKKVGDLMEGLNKGTIKPEELADKVTALKKEIEDYRDTHQFDGINDEQNKASIAESLRKLDNIKVDKKGPVTTITTPNDGVTIIINGKPINSVEDLEELAKTPQGEAALKGLDKTTARHILLKLGYLDDEEGSMSPSKINADSKQTLAGKLSNKYSVLLVLQQSEVCVEVEHNPTSKVKDHWISGPITNVTKDENGKLSYDVDCTRTGETGYQAQYTLTATDNTNQTFHATKKRGTVTVDSTRDLKFQGEKKPLLNNGDPVARA